ncbi:MAG: ATP-binding cassette domain-containing protein [Spirochaetaceae bacterium]|jgi:ABC-type Mn2+/Zn2+ transport system ATPase subunit|nr:ATP-binding cassette domain-containing protein [Spirochaetaceae bacterium]
MTGETAIAARRLSAGYGKNIVLKEVSLTVPAGSITGLSGPNGAGKSTFIKLCLGMIHPRSGSITVIGGAPWGREGRKLRLRMAYVPQNTAGGNLPLNVRDAVSMGLYGKSGFFRPIPPKDRLRVEQAMGACGITHLASRRIQELSGGQTQRVAIARALAMDAEILLLDEPASNLDAEGRLELLRIIKERQEYRHITVLIVSHEEETLDECGTIYRFNEGRVTELIKHG